MHVTMNTLVPIVRDMVRANPGKGQVGYLFHSRTEGACFVGKVFEALGLTPQAQDCGDLKVHMLRDAGWYKDLHLDTLPISCLANYKIELKGEPVSFDQHAALALTYAMGENDNGVEWSKIARMFGITSIEVQPDPLPPIKPIKIVTDPPITKKQAAEMSYGEFMSWCEKQPDMATVKLPTVDFLAIP